MSNDKTIEEYKELLYKQKIVEGLTLCGIQGDKSNYADQMFDVLSFLKNEINLISDIDQKVIYRIPEIIIEDNKMYFTWNEPTSSFKLYFDYFNRNLPIICFNVCDREIIYNTNFKSINKNLLFEYLSDFLLKSNEYCKLMEFYERAYEHLSKKKNNE